METGHIVRAYEDELKMLSTKVVRMGGLVEAQIEHAVEALVRRDTDLAQQTVGDDARIDDLEQDINDFAVRLLALRQPVADDLRGIVGALKISSDLERMGDYASNVAKRCLVLNQLPPVRPVATVPRMAAMVQEITADVIDAYLERDLDKARDAWVRDREVDDIYTALFRELVTFMMEDQRTITSCTHLMFIAKNLERIGDHAGNIAETIHYLVTGNSLSVDDPASSAMSSAGFPPYGGSSMRLQDGKVAPQPSSDGKKPDPTVPS